jgi:hypothetical protein
MGRNGEKVIPRSHLTKLFSNRISP